MESHVIDASSPLRKQLDACISATVDVWPTDQWRDFVADDVFRLLGRDITAIVLPWRSKNKNLNHFFAVLTSPNHITDATRCTNYKWKVQKVQNAHLTLLVAKLEEVLHTEVGARLWRSVLRSDLLSNSSTLVVPATGSIQPVPRSPPHDLNRDEPTSLKRRADPMQHPDERCHKQRASVDPEHSDLRDPGRNNRLSLHAALTPPSDELAHLEESGGVARIEALLLKAKSALQLTQDDLLRTREERRILEAEKEELRGKVVALEKENSALKDQLSIIQGEVGRMPVVLEACRALGAIATARLEAQLSAGQVDT